jgi:SPX domain protein involved in polyphosphate accumulation
MISRYEIKFKITNDQKERFLDAAKVNLRPDPFGDDACYRVTSVYYDSPNLDFYWQKADGEAIRRKLRLRFYGQPASPDSLKDHVFFLELKHRIKDSVGKERIKLTPEGALSILNDYRELQNLKNHIDEKDLMNSETVSIMQWLHNMMQFQAANTISYHREAWIGTVDQRLRLTFDQMASAYSPDSFAKVGIEPGLPLIAPGESIMEIKFNQSIPRWIRDIVIAQKLVPQRFSKYATGIDRLWQPIGREIGNYFSMCNPS